MKRYLPGLAPVLALLIGLSALNGCAAKIRFPVQKPAQKRLKLMIVEVLDKRPLSEKRGYKIFYISSINDSDYKGGFTAELTRGLQSTLDGPFTLVHNKKEADFLLSVEALNYYGEYSHSVKSVFLEYLSCFLLFTPRLVSNWFPYNHFAGRARLSFTFQNQKQERLRRTLDVKLSGRYNTWQRSPRSTSSMLSKAAGPKLDGIIREVYRKALAGPVPK